jgi:hypothetical protein
LVATGILLRRAIKTKARAYEQATEQGVMEVRRA